MSSLEQQVRQLQDRAEIMELMAAYCRHADRHDADSMSKTFTEDGVGEYVPRDGVIFRGQKELRDFFAGFFEMVTTGSHFITNAQLLFDAPDTVTGHFYMMSIQKFKGPAVTADCFRFGRYENLFVRTPEGWRISKLRLLVSQEIGGDRIGEQFDRPWPPTFDNL